MVCPSIFLVVALLLYGSEKFWQWRKGMVIKKSKLLSLYLLVFLHLSSLAYSEVVIKSADSSHFEFDVFFVEASITSESEKDPFTGQVKNTSLSSMCIPNLIVTYKGEEDFIYKDQWVALTLLLQLKSGQVIQHEIDNSFAVMMNKDQVYKTGDSIGFSIGASVKTYTNVSKVDLAAEDTAYRCNAENIASAELLAAAFSIGNITFRSGRQLSGTEFVRKSSISLKGSVNPENIKRYVF
jgi:hypothetical protein